MLPSDILLSIQSKNPWLLVSDVDDTLTGDDEALVELARALRRAKSVMLVLNSSRPTTDIERTLDRLPCRLEPHGIIGAMGTEIVWRGELDRLWTKRFQQWDRRAIDAWMKQRGFAPHSTAYQTAFKASFTVPKQHWQEVQSSLEETGIEARVVFSGESNADVLPVDAGKGEAIGYLVERLGIAHDRLLVAGDSENDADMFEFASKGILVGNALENMKETVSGANVYRSRGHHAAGVIEGLRYYGVIEGP